MKRWLGVLAVTLVSIACSSSDDTAGGGACTPALGANSGKCPDTNAAETAYARMKTACAITESEIDGSNAASPTLAPSAKPKTCSSCGCRNAIYDYETLYQGCTDSDKSNAAFAKNLYDLAAACK